MSQMDRFRRLEGPRAGRQDDQANSAEERFSRVEPERAPASTPAPAPGHGAAAQRIGRQVSEQPLALDDRSTAEQPFIRCMRCEADNNRHAQECAHCGAALQTEEQRAFNDDFWAKRQAEQAEEAEAVERFHAAQEQAAKRAEAERAETVAAIAVAVGQEIRASSAGMPPALRMLRAVADPGRRFLAACGFGLWGLISLIGLFKSRGPAGQLLSLGGLLLLGILWTPSHWWTARRRRGWWTDDDDWDPDDYP
ncbi:MAG TPA: hypothetical protein VND93_11735 [Myxococcales bacterium]|nr:hypothetical protein [Myxococcales bacterium]